MKIDGVRGPSGVSSTSGASRTRQTGGAAFTPAASEAPRVAGVSAVQPTPALDAILLLQGEAVPDQRQRQARRGKRLLDALERLTRALLEGVAPASLRGELESLHGQAQPTGDPGLDEVLREIDTRTAVELAKLERLAPA
ncbi:MAG: flagellar assembly protein FliX [Hyphomonadaceae bacterium]